MVSIRVVITDYQMPFLVVLCYQCKFLWEVYNFLIFRSKRHDFRDDKLDVICGLWDLVGYYKHINLATCFWLRCVHLPTLTTHCLSGYIRHEHTFTEMFLPSCTGRGLVYEVLIVDRTYWTSMTSKFSLN